MSSASTMVKPLHILLMAPLLVTASLPSAAAVGSFDQAALTGQLIEWSAPEPTAEPEGAPPSPRAALAAPAEPGQAMDVADLIAKGPISVDTLVASAPANASLPTAPKQSQAAEAGVEPTEITVTATANGLAFSSQMITLRAVDDKISLRIVGAAAEGLQLFVRDQQIAALSAKATQLSARKIGATELYAVARGRMYIIPVQVAAPSRGGPSLAVPEALVSLSGVVKEAAASATYPGLQQATASEGLADGGHELPLPAADELEVEAKQAHPEAPTLKTSIAETARSLVQQANAGRRFYHAKDKIAYTTAQLQLIDDRSVPSAGLIYPVAGVTVRVLGTEFLAKTDATGHLTIRDMPRRSRFMLRIDDPGGQYRPAIAELSTTDLAGGVVRLKVMRTFAFDALTAIAATVQQSTRGSYCASATEQDGTDHTVSAAGVSAQLDVVAEGPFYFNQFGFLDRSMRATGPDGRFCFFNIPGGPVALSLFRGDSVIATLPVSVFANRHVEDDVRLAAEAEFATRFASMATAQEQLSSDVSTATHYQQVDMIDLVPLGTDTPLAQVAPGQAALPEPLLTHQGRLRAFARAAEFEPTVYTYAAGDEQAVTPLIPRGFVEDMALNAQVTHDPDLGVVFAEYAAPEGATQETVSMRLVDQDGHDVGDGWYFSDAPVTKALFFNVPSGTYSLQVQTKDGYWLTSDTVIVYSETVSYVRLGGALRYQQ